MTPALSGEVAIVTGASAGIGAAVAAALAREGAIVVLAARRAERLQRVADAITSSGGDALPVVADVTSAEDRRRLVDSALAVAGRVDILVNNAGYGQRGPVEAIPVERIRENFETNVFGAIALIQLVAPHMRSRRRGRIVNVSSLAGRIARPYSSTYDATKHALEAFSDGLRAELRAFGIHVVVIEPGFTRTEFAQVAAARELVSAPYAAALEAFTAAEATRRRFAVDPDRVARQVVRAAVTSAPRSRYVTPAAARVVLLLKRVLPDRFFDRLVVAAPAVSQHRP